MGFTLINSLTIALFLLLSYCFGYSTGRLAKITELKHHMISTLALGFAVMSFFAIILNVLHLPIDIKIYFLAFIIPLYDLWKKRKNNFAYTKEITRIENKLLNKYTCILLIIFLVHLTVFWKGAFSYAYLEDDDPWGHAEAVKYITETKTYDQKGIGVFHYLEPYPPTFDALIAIFHQLNPDLNFLLKAINALIVSLGLLFFYAFVVEFYRKKELDESVEQRERKSCNAKKIALIATFILATLPAYASHFIWSHSLGLTLLPVALLFTLQAARDQQYIILAIIAIASAMVAHPVVSLITGVIITILLLVNMVLGISHKNNCVKAKWIFIAALLGLLLGMLFWGQQVYKYGITTVLTKHSGGLAGHSTFGTPDALSAAYINPSYNFTTIVTPQLQDTIDQQKGYGIITSMLTVLGVVLLILSIIRTDENREANIAVLLWFSLMVVGLLGPHFGVGILTHRFWAYLAFPLAIVAGYALVLAGEQIRNKHLQRIIILFIIIMILVTSGYTKYVFQTGKWPGGIMWVNNDELESYAILLHYPKNTPVFTLCSEDKRVIGFNMLAYPWKKEITSFRQHVLEKTKDELYTFLNNNGFSYFIVDATCAKIYGEEKINALLYQLQMDRRFEKKEQTNSFFLFMVRNSVDVPVGD